MKYLSVCSGIEAASVAWQPLGWEPFGFAEIDKFSSAILAHHYPHVPNFGDMTKFKEWPNAKIDLLIGGTPCQSFSVAGLRQGLDDPRGNLALTYCAILDKYRPRWFIWENVPGVLSTDEGRAFGSILGAVAELGYGFAYRVLDAQYIRVDGFVRAVPQRRRRVFVVGYLGDWRRAAAVLFERESLQGNTPPRRQAGQGFTHDVVSSLVSSGRGVERTGETRAQDPVIAIASTSDVAHRLNAGAMGRIDYESETMIAHTPLRANGFDAGEDGTGRGTPLIPIHSDAVRGNSSALTPSPDAEGRIRLRDPGIGIGAEGDPSFTLAATGVHAIAFSCKDHGADAGSIAPTLRSMGHDGSHANAGGQLAVAFDLRGREDGSQFEGPHHTANIRAASGGSSRSYVACGVSDTLSVGANQTTEFKTDVVAFTCSEQANGFAWERDVWQTLDAQIPNDSSNIQKGVRQGWDVRRLTPTECERLQGFPDNYTLIPVRGKPAADGPRYKALGNSMAVNVIRWLGRRIEMAETHDRDCPSPVPPVASRPLKARIWNRVDDEWYLEPTWCSIRLFQKESFRGGIYDPCCGVGNIVIGALRAGLKGYGSDLVNRGFDSTRTPHDFLSGHDERHDNIVCNPPFDMTSRFAQHALKLTRRKVAMIFPVARLNAAHWIHGTPLARIWLLTPRPSMPPGNVVLSGEKPGGGKVDFCWLVWDHRHTGQPEMRWLHRDQEKQSWPRPKKHV